MHIDWAAIRAEFRSLDHWTYLNTATMGLVSARANAAAVAHYARRDEFANTDFGAWWEDVDRVRASVARLIGAVAVDIGFFPNSSAILALVAASIGWQDGDEILTLTDEFPNQFYFAHSRAKLVETTVENFFDAVTPRTRLVAISSVNYQTGLLAPYEAIGKFLQERGIFYYLDATQSVGTLRMNATASCANVVAVNTYKWLASPPGAAFAYINAETRASMPPTVVGWRSDAGWRDMHNLRHAPPKFSGTAEMYEGGMLAFSALYPLGATVDWMLEIGPAAIEARVLHLARLVSEALRELGGTVANEGSSIVAAKLSGVDVNRLASELNRQRIVVSARRGHLRVSPHFYNDDSDVERFRHAIQDAMKTAVADKSAQE